MPGESPAISCYYEHYERKAEILIAKLKALPQSDSGGDYEAGHVEADKILCDLLMELGWGDVVKAWENVGKWCA
jgi:hypothetical protein